VLQAADHALSVAAIARRHVIAIAATAEIDVVQATRLLPQRSLRRVVLHLVGPARDIGQRLDMFRRQQPLDFGFGGRTQMALRQFGDHAVPERSPRTGRRDKKTAQQSGDEVAFGEHAMFPVETIIEVCHRHSVVRATLHARLPAAFPAQAPLDDWL
jgi:hypothetical protein